MTSHSLPSVSNEKSIRAVLLAAGIGARLQPFTHDHPKCLTQVGKRTLLEHHLEHLSQIPEISDMVIVTGYLESQIRDAVAEWSEKNAHRFSVTFESNPEFRKGSILSLRVASDHLCESDTVIMDADVLYPRELMERLLRSQHSNCFLMDESCEPTGEEMMICVKDDKVRHIARSREASTQRGWDLTGEGVGFFRLNKFDSKRLVALMDSMVEEGLDHVEYEAALDRFMKEHDVGYVSCSDFPWTEIDFPEDVDKATQEVFPSILRAGLTL